MNVQELIDRLEKVEDKTMTVCLSDWSEEYATNHELNTTEVLKELTYVDDNDEDQVATYYLLDVV